MAAVVTSMGLISAVGLTAPQSCAAVRCGITRFSELTEIVDGVGEPITGATISLNCFCPSGGSRQIQMIEAVCSEALGAIPTAELAARNVTISVLLSTVWESTDAKGWMRDALQRSSPIFVSANPPLFFTGCGAGALAIAEAVRRIEEDANRIEVIVGFDCLVDRRELIRLDRAHRLKTSGRPRGVIPGEAAACVVIESVLKPGRSGRSGYCSIEGTGTAMEEHPISSDKPAGGQGLAEAIRKAAQTAGWKPNSISQVYCDLNGEDYKAYEWGFARLRTEMDPDVKHPADCIGDIGAAFLPALICFAGAAFRNDYANGSRVAAFCGSEDGLRGAVCLRAIKE